MRFDVITHHQPSNLPLWPPFCSFYNNLLDAEGGKAIGEALKVNTSITNIEYDRFRIHYRGAIMRFDVVTHR